MPESHSLIWLKILTKTCRYIKKHITRYDKLSIIQNSIFAIEYKCIKKTDIYYIHNYNRGGKNIMKKSTILSLATAGAIVATSAFTFAAWDKLDDTQTVATVELRNPVTVTEDTSKELTTTTPLDTIPVYTGTATVNVSEVPENYRLDTVAEVYNESGAKVSSGVTATATLAGTLSAGNNTINVEVKPTSETNEEGLAGQKLNVKVIAKLVEKTN